MAIIYNPSVILYQNGIGEKGIDFAAFEAATSTTSNRWTVDKVTCYYKKTCSWYDQSATPLLNILYESDSTATTPYNIHYLDCLATASSVGDCDNWQGYKLVNDYGGIFSMRRVRFPKGFHS